MQKSAGAEKPIHETISTPFRSFLTVIIMTGSFIAILDTTVVDVVIPKMMGPLSTDLYGIQWVITSYMTAAAIALLLTHNLSHVIGLKRLFVTGIFIFTGASAMCGIAQSLETMILFRAVQGAGEAFIMASAQTMLFSIYPPDKKGLAMGIYAMGVSFAPSLGPTVGGWITEHMSWRWVFYINLPIGVINMAAAAFFLPVIVHDKIRLRFNFISYFFIGCFTLFTLILLSKGQQYGWFQSTKIGFMAFGAAIAFLSFLLSEMLSEHKLIDPEIFKNHIYTLSLGFYFFILGLSIYQLFYLLPLYYENLKLLGTFDTGIHMLAFAIFIAIFSPLAGILSDRFGPQRVLTFSCLLYLFTTWFLMPSLNYYTPSVRAAIITIPLGIGLGALFAPLSAMALGNLGDKTAQGVSLMHYLRFIGGSFGTAIATNVLEKKIAVHIEGIGFTQNLQYVRNFTENTALRLLRLFPPKIAAAKGHLFTAKIQGLHAMSFAFQDTFRNTFFFALIGTLFFVGIIIVKQRQTRHAETK